MTTTCTSVFKCELYGEAGCDMEAGLEEVLEGGMY